MIGLIVGALLPGLVTVLLGYVAAKHHDFDPRDASVLTRMVMTYALPVGIFAGTVATSRAELAADMPLLIALAVAIIGVYAAVFLACRAIWHRSLGEAALAALAASAPTAPFLGPAVLGYLYGAASGVPIAVETLIVNLTVVPLTIVFMSLTASSRDASAAGRGVASRQSVAAVVVSAIKEPIIWLPVLGFLIVLADISVPAQLTNAFFLLGNASSGVALFATGIILAGYHLTITPAILGLVFIKNIAQPALVWVGLLALGYTNPLLSEAVISAALPMLVLTAILGVQYRISEEQAASTLLLSMGTSLVTLGVFIALTGA
jgi:predicted permease